MASYEYTIGANGERLSCTELGRTVEYAYDALERLTSETVTVGSAVSVTTYTYDSNSNRLSMNRDGEVTNYTYNSLNQITQAGDVSYTWDNAGNLVSQSQNGTLVAAYSYDCHNRMISADINNISGNIVESYTYDYLGNRTSKTTNGETTYFTTDLSTGYSQVLKAETANETVYYTRGFELISRRVGTDASYYLYDGGMSVRALTDESGVVTDTFVFDAFGNEVARTGTTDNSYGFQGEEKDATGLYYLRARYMDPSTGTFTSVDTYAGSLSDPMSLHKYLFANSNPVKYCDPSGHVTLEDFSLAVGMGAIIGSAFSALDYTICALITDPGFEKHNLSGLCNAIIMGWATGALFGIVFFLLALIPGLSLCFWALVGMIMGIANGFYKIAQGIIDIMYGDETHGIYELVMGLITILISIGVYNGAVREDTYYPGHRGPLSEAVTNTFNGGTYTRTVLSEETVVYRTYGGVATENGSYYSFTSQNGGLQSQLDSALVPEWGNTCEYTTQTALPVGTTIYYGSVAPQPINTNSGNTLGMLPGGGSQVYVPPYNDMSVVFLVQNMSGEQ